jgi:hypothetical protein
LPCPTRWPGPVRPASASGLLLVQNAIPNMSEARWTRRSNVEAVRRVSLSDASRHVE